MLDRVADRETGLGFDFTYELRRRNGTLEKRLEEQNGNRLGRLEL